MYDLLILGSGPAGYVAAIRASQLGLKVGCIEKGAPGGTCLNIGCIPSKTLLDSSQKYHELRTKYANLGIDSKDISLDLAKMMTNKQDTVLRLVDGVKSLLKSNKIEFIKGTGKVVAEGEVEVSSDNKPLSYRANNIIIATGSYPVELPNIKFSEDVVDSEGALSFQKVPNNLVIVGAGAIGLELGSVWSRLGSNVTILEAQKEFLPPLDRRVSRLIQREFKLQGLSIFLDCQVQALNESTKGIEIDYKEKEQENSIEADKVILAVGRKANLNNLFSEELKPSIKNGLIEVNDFCQTDVKGIWAIGDVVRGPKLAHKASEEGIMVAERIAGLDAGLNYGNIPNVIYTHPEIAWVGMSEDELKKSETSYKAGSFPFSANGRALTAGETSGIVKMYADASTDKILGVQVFGPSASELVQQALIAMDNGITSKKLGETVFSHPTVSEALHEANLSINARAIHIQNKL